MDDYKRKYEEALGRARTFSQRWQGIEATDSELALQELKEIFPELKESEDESIRKSIIDLVEKQMPKSENKKWMLAWLERQNGQKPSDKVEPKFKVGDWIIRNKNIELANSLMLVAGKHNNEYLCKHIDGQCSYNIEFIDKDYHLWTIQDANDGDVLAYKNDIVIFKENNYNLENKSGCMFVYCSCNNFYEIGGINPINYKPATKEQRDLLFRKMKEAGYEWDADKKELRKVDKNPEINDNILLRFAFYQYDDDTLYLSSVFVEECNRKHGYGTKILKAAEEVAKTFGISKIRLKVERNTWMEEWYKKNGYEYLSPDGEYDWLENRVIDIKPDKIERVYPSWGEEDESNLDSAIYYIRREPYRECDVEPIVDWMRELKERLKEG